MSAIHETKENTTLVRTHWEKAIDYAAYKKLIENLVCEHKTTGPEQTEERISVTGLNLHRMKRVEKTFELTDQLEAELHSLPCTLKWLVITEGWCGDSAQIVPALYKIAEESGGKIEMKTILRDEYPELMDAFLTNGTRSVPKLIIMDEHFRVLGTWGPRPEQARKLVTLLKSDPVKAGSFKEELHKWYALDRSRTVEDEIAALLLLVCQMQKRRN